MAGKTPDTGCRVGVGNGVNVYEVVVGATGVVDGELLPETQVVDILWGTEDEGGPQVGRGGERGKESVDVVLGEAERTRGRSERNV